MKKYKGYLIDLDGTMYRGSEVIKEAADFVAALRESGTPYLYVTNNSSKTPGQVADHLRGLGIDADEEEVFTTSMATANYLHKQKPAADVYVIGEEGIRTALEDKGFRLTDENPDAVVVGIDRRITYEKLATACLAVRSGALFISTNGDIALPTERGLLPGNGALTSVISVSTQKDPVFIGKPYPIIMEGALQALGTAKEETIMVGDNYDTDILAGIRYGMDTLIVHTGVTTEKLLAEQEIQPTHAVLSLADWQI